jgi:vacuolar-type H+-ATPase subunit I/STV1
MEALEHLTELKVMVTDYLSARLKLVKLDFYEKTAKVLASLFSSLVIAFLSGLLLLFLSITLGFYLGEVLKSTALGFLIVSGIYFLILLPVIFFGRNTIEKAIINRLLSKLNEKEKEE